MPKVSVLMSIFKEPVDWIKLSIESILNQTYSDYEFIIINDNPELAENLSILNHYASKDPRIVIINNEHNIGLTKSLNKGLEVARGEYIARMDADDISLPMRFEKQIAFMNNNPEVFALGAQATIIDENGKRIGKWNVNTEWSDLKSSLLFKSPIVHPLAFFKRLIDGTPVKYDESFIYSQDYALWATLIKDHKIVNLDESLLLYRISTLQISIRNNDLQTECAIKIQEYIFKTFNYKVNASIKKTIGIITKKRITKIKCHDLLIDVKTFAETNVKLGGSIMRTLLFKNVCNYAPYHYNVFYCTALAVRLSFSINKFDFYSFVSMLYKCLRNTR